MEDRRPRLSGQAGRLSSTGRNPMIILRRFLTTSDRDAKCVADAAADLAVEMQTP